MHLTVMGLADATVEGNLSSLQNDAKIMSFLHHHFLDDLNVEYLIVKNSLILWTNLKERFGHQKMVVLPKVWYDAFAIARF
jgi:hypothetical protein